jgi:hypothetical protein
MAMSTTEHDHFPASRGSSGPSRSVKTALLMVAAVGGFYLLREHWGHVAGNWVYLLLLACPLMHLFHGHGGHGRHGSHDTQSNKPFDKQE